MACSITIDDFGISDSPQLTGHLLGKSYACRDVKMSGRLAHASAWISSLTEVTGAVSSQRS